ISRCDSAAMVPNTSELLPEPETPVNTVSRRFGSSTLMSLRLFTRAPCTRIRSWLSATCSDCGSVLVAVLIAITLAAARKRRFSIPDRERFRGVLTKDATRHDKCYVACAVRPALVGARREKRRGGQG